MHCVLNKEGGQCLWEREEMVLFLNRKKTDCCKRSSRSWWCPVWWLVCDRRSCRWTAVFSFTMFLHGLLCLHWHCVVHGSPDRKPGMSDVSPLSGISGLSFDSTLLSPLLFILLPSPVTLSVSSFSACWSILLNLKKKILQCFLLRDMLFCMAPV